MMVSDFHSHILPGIDDGSKSVEESLEMLRLHQQQGVPMVLATPHFYGHRDTIEGFLSRRETAAAQLSQAMAGMELPQVLIGAEVYYFPGISETQVLQNLVIQGTDCILIEMPPQEWTQSMYREIAMIPERQGLQPIIAHIDRYIRPLRSNTHIRRMLELPVWIQANGESFLNRWTQNLCLKMLAQDQIQLLGSDCHNLSSRTPNLDRAVEKIREKLGDAPLARIREWEAAVFELQEDIM